MKLGYDVNFKLIIHIEYVLRLSVKNGFLLILGIKIYRVLKALQG